MSDSLLEPLLQSPCLPEHLEVLNRVLATEHQRRQKFYDEIAEDRKWEFINGQVIMHSPATNRHNRPLARLFNLLLNWANYRQLGQVTVEKTLCQFPRNDYEPDIVYFGTAKSALIQPKTLLHPVPDFIVEVLSETTTVNDLGIELQDYEAHGVQEYWIVDPEAETVEQFLLQESHYGQPQRLSEGRICSRAVVGFEISVQAIFDDTTNLSEFRRLLDTSR